MPLPLVPLLVPAAAICILPPPPLPLIPEPPATGCSAGADLVGIVAVVGDDGGVLLVWLLRRCCSVFVPTVSGLMNLVMRSLRALETVPGFVYTLGGTIFEGFAIVAPEREFVEELPLPNGVVFLLRNSCCMARTLVVLNEPRTPGREALRTGILFREVDDVVGLVTTFGLVAAVVFVLTVTTFFFVPVADGLVGDADVFFVGVAECDGCGAFSLVESGELNVEGLGMKLSTAGVSLAISSSDTIFVAFFDDSVSVEVSEFSVNGIGESNISGCKVEFSKIIFDSIEIS